MDTSLKSAVVDADLYAKATVTNYEQGLLHAQRIGFPVMVYFLYLIFPDQGFRRG
jgi:hypothetical protein